jgi:Uma2 family endonuclease
MPDLAVEVQSPGQTDKLMADKAAYYLANGTRMVWLVYPGKQLVEVLTQADRQLLPIDDTLTGEPLLPGFTLPVRELFPEDL